MLHRSKSMKYLDHVQFRHADVRQARASRVPDAGHHPDAGCRRRRFDPLGSRALRFVRPAPAAATTQGAARAGQGEKSERGGYWMRALGPGSVASFLKIILDVVFAALWISLGALGRAMLAALLFSFNPDLFPAEMSAEAATVARTGPLLVGFLLVAGLLLGGVLVFVHSLWW